MPIRNRFAELHDEITAWRRDFHEHPELSFDVHRTAGIVAEKLKEFGCDEVVTGIGRTGVVGIIRGRSIASGRTVGLRADMDALPIEEATGVAYASKTPGKMHACGHDGHTAMLLGAAKYLAETRNFDGSVAVIFQPAEEGGGGGREMVNDGMMDRFGIDEVYGMHNWPGVPLGEFAIRPGPMMAATDVFEAVIEVRGGHGAKPDETVDPTIAACQAILALQTIASRNIHPLDSLVVSVTSFETSSRAFNVIPQSVHLKGTVRTLAPEVQDLAEQRLRDILTGVSGAMGCSVSIDYKRNYPVTSNHKTETRYAIEAARRVGVYCDEDVTPTMGGEDFSFMLNVRPGAYIFLGNGDSAKVHSPDYNFDDEAIPFGCSWFVEMVESRLPIG